MKLSDLSPEDVQPVDSGAPGAPLKLSGLHPDDVRLIQPPDPTFEDEHPTLAKIAKTAKDAGRATVNALPMIGGVAGGILGTPADAVVGPAGNMVGAGIGGYLGTAAKNAINRVIDPESAPQTMGKVMLEPVVEGTRQALAQGTGEAIAPYLNQAAANFAKGSGSVADDLLLKATGATGAQAGKFPEGSLEELRTPRPELGGKKIVNFGSSPADIAENSQKVMDAAEASKDQIVNKSGVNVSRNKVLDYLRAKLRDLSGNESQIDLVKAIKSKMGDIQGGIDNAAERVELPLRADNPEVSGLELNYGKPGEVQTIYPEAPKTISAELPEHPNRYREASPVRQAVKDKIRGEIGSANVAAANEAGYSPYSDPVEVRLQPITKAGSIQHPEIPLSKAEEIRKGFDQVGNWERNTHAVSSEANKIAANAYRQANEEAALAADPELGAAFKAAKTTQHNLIPVKNAAEKRALTLNQSPMGGLLSHTAGGVGAVLGAATGGPVGAAVGFGAGLASKALRPRLASMAYASVEALSNALESNPTAFGSFAPVLAQAAAHGSRSLATTDALLQKLYPEYADKRDRALSK